MYGVNEMFFSLQGEGVRAGTANLFVRFSGCNLKCNGTSEGEAYQPVCDTEFVSHTLMTADDLVTNMQKTAPANCRNVIFTGGEPALQLDRGLVERLHGDNWHIAVESNGTKPLPEGLDWVCISPKTAEHTLVEQKIHELKYVRPANMAIPKPRLKADHYLVSPAFDHTGNLPMENLQWCIQLVQQNPRWRLSVQQHKAWRAR